MPDALGSMTALTMLCVAAPRRCLRDAPPRLASACTSQLIRPRTHYLLPPRYHISCSHLQYTAISGTIPDAVASMTALTHLCVAAPLPPRCAASPHFHVFTLTAAAA
jgi:hypothetical protein